LKRLWLALAVVVLALVGCGDSGGPGAGSTKNPTLSGKVPVPQPTTRGTTTSGG
jgi:hypothetical protein